jgi:N-acetylglucosaminyldiphosphoundecaprenol N-acetyl-beta-D-mannosaminyltransferase
VKSDDLVRSAEVSFPKQNLLSIIRSKYGPEIEEEELPEGLTTFLNPYSYLIARKHRDIFQEMDHIFIDSIMLVKSLSVLKIAKCRRRIAFDMAGLAPFVFFYAQIKQKTIFFIGTRPSVIDTAIKNIKSMYPQLRVLGYQHGYFYDNKERENVLDHIVALHPDFVVVGMGTPLQERFLLDLKARGWRGAGFTCGGFLHQTAKRIKYYPDWIDEIYLNALFRLYDEPKLVKRYFVQYPKFLPIFLFDFIKFKIG